MADAMDFLFQSEERLSDSGSRKAVSLQREYGEAGFDPGSWT
jgi:hypothetical protein